VSFVKLIRRSRQPLGTPLFLATLLIAASASARVRQTCVEQWFDGDPTAPTATSDCKQRRIDARGTYFGVIDGKAYFHVTVSDDFTTSTLRRADTENIRLERNFWPLQGEVRPQALRTWSRDGRTAPRYATDGAHVFYQWRAIAGADAASFEVLNGQLNANPADDAASAGDSADWARDRGHVYFQGRPVAQARPGDLRRIQENLVASNGHVYETDADEIKERADVDASLHRLNWAYSADRTRVYFRGRPMAGVDRASFAVMQPVCPVPGHPGLRCDPPAKFDADRRKEGFHDDQSPAAAGAYYWWARDKNVVYRDGEPFESGSAGAMQAVRSKDLQFVLLPGQTDAYVNPATNQNEIYPRSVVYLIDKTRIYLSDGVGSPASSLAYDGPLSGPSPDAAMGEVLRDRKGRIFLSLDRIDR
jgi:hypothetical protein